MTDEETKDPGTETPEGSAEAPAGEELQPTETPTPGEAKKSDLPARLVTAAVAIPLILYLVYLGGAPFALLIVAVVCLGLVEFFRIMEAKGIEVQTLPGVVFGGGLALVMYAGGGSFLGFALTLMLLGFFLTQLAGEINRAIVNTAATLFGVMYVGWLTGHAILLRNIGRNLIDRTILDVHGPEVPFVSFEPVGIFLIVLVVACTFLSDSGAYFAGRAYGKHRISPRVSPKKTWEGLAGGFAASLVGALVVKLLFRYWFFAGRAYEDFFGLRHCLILALIITAGGFFGDLFESLLKRDARIKDAGGLLPGHGGFLDRLDSLSFAFPLAYYYVLIYVVNGLAAEGLTRFAGPFTLI